MNICKIWYIAGTREIPPWKKYNPPSSIKPITIANNALTKEEKTIAICQQAE